MRGEKGSNVSGKVLRFDGKEVKTIDLTPTWIEIVSVLVRFIMEPSGSKAYKAGMKELLKMATIADNCSELVGAANTLLDNARDLEECFDYSGKMYDDYLALEQAVEKFKAKKIEKG